jgi:6-phosphogluconolactonase
MRSALTTTLSLLVTACTIVIGCSSRGDVAEGDTGRKQFVYVSGYSPTISCFTLDAAAGTLTPASTSPGGKNPSFLAWSPDHRFVYALNEADPTGRVLSFSVNPENGALTKINDAGAAGKGTCHLSVHPSGKWLATANYGSGHVGILPIKPDGSLGEAIDTELPGKNAHEALWDDTGAFLFVPCLGSDHIAQYRFNAISGQLTPNDPASVATDKGAGPRHLCFNPKRTFAYGINELNGTISTYTYDAAKGLLTAIDVVATLPADFKASGKRNNTAEIVVLGSGKFLYGSNRGHDSIAIYRLDPVSGKPTFLSYENGGGDVKEPRHFSIDPSQHLALIASQKADHVTLFRIDPEQGTLSKISTIPVPPGPSFIATMSAP